MTERIAPADRPAGGSIVSKAGCDARTRHSLRPSDKGLALRPRRSDDHRCCLGRIDHGIADVVRRKVILVHFHPQRERKGRLGRKVYAEVHQAWECPA